ncbi:MAG TPA: ABC transporter permease [Nannocystaceae bacterium]|nr:ABC transporter permease [Nannocystaceae bacterium]
MSRLVALAKKELLQLRRDRMTLAMTFMLPLVQILLFGYAINTDVRHIPTVVFDQDHSAASRDLVRRMEATGYYDIVGQVESYDQIARALRSGRARVALVVPPELGSQQTLGRKATVQLVVDGSDPQTVGSATNTAATLVAQRSAELQVARLRERGVMATGGGLSVEPTIWYNPEQLTAVYVVPGLVGVILTMTMVMLTAMAVARERERGTLEALIVSPARRIEIVLGKIVPYILIGYVQMSIVLLAGKLIFKVPLAGSLWLLYGCAMIFIAASLSIGLVFSTIAKTQQQAMQMSFFFFLPNILLSGFMFPFEGMPRPAQYLSQALPLTHFLRIVRRITLQGAGIPDVEGELVWLGGILLVLLVLASARFKKKLVS